MIFPQVPIPRRDYDADRKPMPNPTPADMADAVFNAIWNVIKTWDVNVPQYYSGYCGANDSHVMLILDALRQVPSQSMPVQAQSHDEGRGG